MAQLPLEIKLEGPAVSRGLMPVRDLTPALTAYEDLFVDAGRILYPDLPAPTLNVQSTRDGSFLIDLLLTAPEAWDNFVDLFSSRDVTAIVNLAECVALARGLLWFIQKTKQRTIVEVANSEEPDISTARLEDETEIEVLTQVIELYQVEKTRHDAEAVVQPLRAAGIQVMSFDARVATGSSRKPVTVLEEDLDAFEVPTSIEDSLLDEERTVMLTVVQPHLFPDDRGGHRWKLSDGEESFYATIEDTGFLERVAGGIETFRSGDLLKCRMREVQGRGPGGRLRRQRSILEVIEHRKGGEQLHLAS